MCGIVGIAGSLQTHDEKTMKRLFMLDHFRGEHSTGLAAIRTDKTVHIAKLGSHSLDLFEMPRFKAALNGFQSKAFIGHNRHATRGGVSTANAHPFQFGHITGVHNGTLDYQSAKRLADACGEEYTVDSAQLFCAFEKLGVEETIALCTEGKDSTTGAWSLVWYDSKLDTLNFLRNQHRPMWWAFNEDYNRLYWASEWPMIQAATKMSETAVTLAKDKEGYDFIPTEVNVWYAFKMSDLMTSGKERPKPTAKFLRGKEATASSHDPFQRTGFPRTEALNTGQGSGGTTGTSTTTSRGTTSSAPSVIELKGSIAQPFAGIIGYAKFDAYASLGCSCCGKDVDFTEKGTIVFERDDILIGPCCSPLGLQKEPDTNRIVVPNIKAFL